MKNVVSALFVAYALSAAVSVAAQGEPAPQSPQRVIQGEQPANGAQQPATDAAPAAPSEQRPAGSQRQTEAAQDNKVTINGCIQNASAPVGITPSPFAAKYVLANAKAGSNASSSTAVGTSGASSTANRYRLNGDDKKISPHLNHQVEITGTVQTSSASAAANPAPGSADAGPMLKVESVKMVSASCQ